MSRGRALLLTAVCALAVRLAWTAACQVDSRSPDGQGYHAYAESLLDRGEFSGPQGEFALRTPGYPLFLAGVYAVGGRSLTTVRIAQSLLSAAACLLLFLIAERLLGSPWGLVCGLAAAAYRGLAEPAVLDTSECVYAFLLATATWLFLGSDRPTSGKSAAGGAVLGAAYLTRPEALPFALIFLAFSDRILPAWRARQRWFALATFCLVAALWTGRNWAVLGRPVPTTTRGGVNLYLGLQLPLEAMGRAKSPIHQPAPGLGEIEADRTYAEAFHELWRETSWGERLRAYSFNLLSMLYPFLPGYDATYVILLPFFLWGLWRAKSRREWRLPAGFVLYSMAVYTVFGGPVSRYRQGFAPFLVLLAVAGMKAARERLGAQGFLRWGSAWACANALIWVLGPNVRQVVLWVRRSLWG